MTDEQKIAQKQAAEAEAENLVLLYEPTAEEISAMNMLGIFSKRDTMLTTGFRQQVKSALNGAVAKNLRERELARRKGNKQDAATYDEVLDALYKQLDRL